MDFKHKYLKYKNKYLNLKFKSSKQQIGGDMNNIFNIDKLTDTPTITNVYDFSYKHNNDYSKLYKLLNNKIGGNNITNNKDDESHDRDIYGGGEEESDEEEGDIYGGEGDETEGDETEGDEGDEEEGDEEEGDEGDEEEGDEEEGDKTEGDVRLKKSASTYNKYFFNETDSIFGSESSFKLSSDI